jgi:exodeoxyribonuclease-3
VLIASWNVNSIRVRLPQVLQWVETTRPDVLAIQETKITDDAFPAADLEAAGYHVLFAGQKTYNGVALLSREPPTDVLTDLTSMEDPQRRLIAATIGGVRIYNVYVPNGQAVGSEKFEYKLRWLAALRQQLAGELSRHGQVVVAGDFNVAPDDRDVHDPSAWVGQVLVSEPERKALAGLLELGLADTFRLFDQPESCFSWWDYRAGAFRRNRGLRIDLLLASRAMAGRCIRSSVDTDPRAWEKPSDHAPIFAQFDED